MSSNKPINRSNFDSILLDLGKEYRRLGGKNAPAEIIIVGGGAIIANYEFRQGTMDIDGVILSMSSLKDAALKVSEKYGLDKDWLNSDFSRTKSYTPKVVEYSKYYKTFSNCLSVRFVTDEYLVAMKLMSDRPYKHDKSDAIGILLESQRKGKTITPEAIDRAMHDLYDGWKDVSEENRQLFQEYKMGVDLNELRLRAVRREENARMDLLEFDKSYPNTLRSDNILQILKAIQERKARDLDEEPER